MNSYKSQLSQNGFCVIPNIVSPDTIKELRDKYVPALSKDLTLSCHEFLAAEDLSNILYSPLVIEIISNIIGDEFCIYPDFTLRKGMYVPWHTDTPYLSQVQTNSDLETNMLQASIYLQDNTLENGGGLEAIPGSHLYNKIDHQNLRIHQIDCSNSIIIPSTAGSLVLWDSRLIHKSREQNKTTQSEVKLAIQGTISRNEEFAEDFLSFLNKRSNEKHKDPIYDQGTREADYIKSMKKLRFPESFNEYQIKNIHKYGLKLKLL